ncbi:hypothetical protein EJB05_49738, partial [Eragrostis curvula]
MVAGNARTLHGAIIIVLATSVAATLLSPAAARNVRTEDCFITDKAGRNWPCSRINDPSAKLTSFSLSVENHLSAALSFDCDDDTAYDFDVAPGKSYHQIFASVFDPAPVPIRHRVLRTLPAVTCRWSCAGNFMSGVVVWDERWPEAWSCRTTAGGGQCRLVFESNREVALVTRAGRRVLGDVAIKECSNNLGGYGGWVPFGLGCTYPKHDHNYYGNIGWLSN